MLNGKITLSRAGDGWIIELDDGRLELFSDAHGCFERLLQLMGDLSGSAAARALLESSQTCTGHTEPTTDPDVAAIAAPGTPPTVPIGD